MTPGRRTLRFDSFDQIMPDVERLLEGCTTVGKWSLAQILKHLATTMRLTADLPASTPQDPSRWSGEERKRQIFETGLLREGVPLSGVPGLLALVPGATSGEWNEADGLRQAIVHYRASSGPVIPHPFIGPMSKVEWDRFQLIHCAHHLSFAAPMES